MGFGYFIDVFGQAFHVVEYSLDTFFFLREMADQSFYILREIFLGNTDVIIGQDKPVEIMMRHKLNILDLGKSRYKVMHSVPFSDRRRVQGDVEDKPFPFEGRCVSSGLTVMLENQSLESLPGKGRGTAQSSEASADDHSIKAICPLALLCALWKGLPIKGNQ